MDLFEIHLFEETAKWRKKKKEEKIRLVLFKPFSLSKDIEIPTLSKEERVSATGITFFFFFLPFKC